MVGSLSWRPCAHTATGRVSPRSQLASVDYMTMLVPFSGSSGGACSSTSSMTRLRAPVMCHRLQGVAGSASIRWLSHSRWRNEVGHG